MIKDNCVIWGIGTIGSSPVLKDMLEQRYNVVAYCDNEINNRTRVNGREVLSGNDMKAYVSLNNVSFILIAVRNREATKNIRCQIREQIAEDVKVFDLCSIEIDQIEKEYLKNKVRSLRFWYDVDFEGQSEKWVENIMSEVTYWLDRYVEKKGEFIDAYIQNNRFLTYAPEYIKFEGRLCNGDMILDIGSGITSKFGCLTESGSKLKICAIDPLAYYYNQFLPQDISEEKKCHFGLFELIANFYEEGSTDGIIINNALDHCIDPFKAIVECLYILRTNKYIAMWHRRAEAVYEKYTGLHRWNVDYNDKDHLIIWNEKNAINITETLSAVADITVFHEEETVPREKQGVYVEIRKKKAFDLESYLDMCRERRNLAKLLERLMQYYAENSTERIQKRLWALQKIG